MARQQPVTEIEGIGPATEQALNNAGYFVTTDLLRAPPTHIHRAVTRLASLENVERWQEMAHFLEIDGMTGQWAEALVADGINTFEELLGKDFATLKQVFDQARAAGTVPDVPGDAEILQFVRDAATLFFTGHLAGTVIDEAGAPLAGVRVIVDAFTEETDTRGRFRISRIPAADGHYLRLEQPGYITLFDSEPHISHDSRGYSTGYWQLAPGEGGPASLDEFAGDPLPPLTSYRTVWETSAEDALRDGDVLKVHERYASSPDVKLVSIFRAYRGGELIIRSFRIGLDRFDGTPEKGELYRWLDGKFLKGEDGPWALEKHRALKKLRRDLASNEGFDRLEPAAKIGWMFETFSSHYVASRLKPG